MIIQPALHNTSPSQRPVSPSGRCIRLRSFTLIAWSVARIRFAIGMRWMVNQPCFVVLAHLCVKPRKSNVSGRLSPRRARCSIAKRPNSIRRVFSFVQLQAELGEALPGVLPDTPLPRSRCSKADHEVIRIAHDDHIAAAAVVPPPLDPQVEDIMQEHVRQAAVRSPRLAAFLQSSPTIRLPR